MNSWPFHVQLPPLTDPGSATGPRVRGRRRGRHPLRAVGPRAASQVVPPGPLRRPHRLQRRTSSTLRKSSSRKPPRAQASNPPGITIEAGEASKSMAVAEDCCRQMIRAGLDRSSTLVALGGGVVGDLAGFVAAIFFRGIPFIQVPTSVVAQVDSSVGRENRRQHTRREETCIGAFHQPRLVLADVATLSSPPGPRLQRGLSPRSSSTPPSAMPACSSSSATPGARARTSPHSSLGTSPSRHASSRRTSAKPPEPAPSSTSATPSATPSSPPPDTEAMLHGEAISLGLAAADPPLLPACRPRTRRKPIASPRNSPPTSFRSRCLPKSTAEERRPLRTSRDKKFVDGPNPLRPAAHPRRCVPQRRPVSQEANLARSHRKPPLSYPTPASERTLSDSLKHEGRPPAQPSPALPSGSFSSGPLARFACRTFRDPTGLAE